MRDVSAKRVLPAFLACLGLLAGCHSPVEPPAPPRPPAPRGPGEVLQPPAGPVTPVAVVQASSSAPNDAERVYAGKLAVRLADWLKAAGIPAVLMTDDDVASGRLGHARAAVLAYNPEPGLRELWALKRFSAQGGRLIVFYSSSPALAEFMGLRLGAIEAATEPGRWGGFRFASGAPEGLPARITQDSRMIRPAYPVSPKARVIATWESATGRPSRDPAWLQSERGFWMTHILLEGDVADKRQMLVALLGDCDPALWRAAADYGAKTAGTLGRFRDTDECVRRLQALAPAADARTAALLTQAQSLQDDMVRALRNASYARVLGTARLLDAALTEAYARTQPSRQPELRGAWNHSGLGLQPGDWDDTCATLARSGFNAVFPNVLKPGVALYRNRIVPESESVGVSGDQLAAAVAAGQRHGVDVHAWVILWNMEGLPEARLAPLRRAGRLQVSATGAPLNWLCPSHPENRAYELDALRDLASRYAVAGIHLDYVRYKSGDYCYCSGCRARFTHDTGLTVRHWPADVRSGALASAWRDWRRARITTFVGAAREAIRRVRPSIQLSAAVYPGYPGCRESIAQDWGEWLRTGQLDFACPMNYSEDTAKITEWYRKQTAYPGVRGRIYPGIGVTSTESRLSAADTIDQVVALRREGAGGFVLFELNPTLKDDILPYLRMGLTANGGR